MKKITKGTKAAFEKVKIELQKGQERVDYEQDEKIEEIQNELLTLKHKATFKDENGGQK